MPEYSYSALHHEDSIRLVQISPGSSDDSEIYCNIVQKRLSKPLVGIRSDLVHMG